ncbi:LptF/LptG family permease [Cytophagaceae bacterium ABcell3]|nr:LptF/LptG family permease [Cytophagaceae bacterium ABcell3]
MRIKLLDWYIFRNFLQTFVFTVVLLVLVICVIDYTERNGDFLSSDVTTREIFLVYYLNFIPYLANMLSPITIFIAAVFVTARFAAHTEIIAMLSSGVSFRRLLMPYVAASILIGILTFGLIGWVIPDANKKRIGFENQYLRNKYHFDGRNVHMKIAPETYVYLESYNNMMDVGYQFTLEYIDGIDMHSKLKANKIVWQEDTETWRLEKYSIREFKDGKESLRFGDRADTLINLHPQDFGDNYSRHETLTLNELEDHILLLQERGAENIEVFLTEKYERYTYPFAILILTVIGVVVSARKSREGTGFKIAFGFFLAFIYIIFVILSRNLAHVGSMGPLVAAWVPNTVFSIIGLMLYKSVPK